ncbi:MAG: ParA family protein [Cytophagales bacterium]|nr:ParA family protein [Cytophagales bacterium]
MKSFALYSLKGGVGKTTSCINLAYVAAKQGKRTLIWDLDPQSAATFYLSKKSKLKGGVKRLLENKQGLEEIIKDTDYKNLFIIPGDLKNREMDLVLDDLKKSKKKFHELMESLGREFDYVFIDSPPMLTILAENIFNAVDYVVSPTIPTTLSMRTLEQVKDFFGDKKLTDKIIPFFTMVDIRKRLHKDIVEGHSQNGHGFLEPYIPYSSVVEKMGLEQAPVNHFSPRSKPAQAYQEIWEDIRRISLA